MTAGSRIRIQRLAWLPVAALIAVACAAQTSNSAGDPPATDTPVGDPIVFGAVAELSGSHSEVGQTVQRALEMKVDELNEAGGIAGRPVELDLRDDETLPDRAVEIVRQFAREDVKAIFGPGPASLCGAAAPVADEAGVPLWCLTPVGELYQHVFLVEVPIDTYLGHIPAQFMSERGWQRVACIHTTDGSGEAYLGSLEAAAERYNLEIVGVESFEPGDADVTAQLTNLQAADPDIIYSCASGNNHIAVLRGMQQLDMPQPVFAGIGGVTFTVAELAAGLLPEGGVFTNGNTMLAVEDLPADLPGRDKAVAFAEAYNARYPDPPDSFAAWAADAFDIVVSVLEDNPDATGTEIAEGIEQVCDYQGVTGRYCFSPDDHRGLQPDISLIVRWTEDGRFELEQLLEGVGTE